MERDVLIINKILQAAYQLRTCQWITAHTIRHHMGETLSISELKHFLEILCDRDLLRTVQRQMELCPAGTIRPQKDGGNGTQDRFISHYGAGDQISTGWF